MDSFSISIKSQYVPLTRATEVINGQECFLHESQRILKDEFNELPEISIISAPTGTGKSYAFPFPVLKNKAKKSGIDASGRIRGLIVLPTNALISELTDNFKKTYPSLVINQITGTELDYLKVKGFERWQKAISLSSESDLIITNPDFLNYAMHGGYHHYAWTRKTRNTSFSSFLDKFSYVIFDEYHLYDEAQIANILTLIRLRDCFLQHYNPVKGSINGVRFLFVSATPENGLKEILENDSFELREIAEQITSDKENARAIHGELDVEFFDCKEIKGLIDFKLSEIREVIKTQRVLIILDKLRDVLITAAALREALPNINIYESTGYISKHEDQISNIKDAQIIIATNKAEVGVNYEVEYCIMQPGKYFQNLIQRFGRISRGAKTGKIIIATDSSYNKIKRKLEGSSPIDYYHFMEELKTILQGKKFYSELVPAYCGEQMWCITNQIRRFQEYEVWQYLNRRLSETDFFKRKDAQRFFLFQTIHNRICEMMKIALKKKSISQTYWDDEVAKLKKRSPRTYEWALWWKRYIDTYLSFRDNSIVVKVVDEAKNLEIEYSLDWILQNKVIKNIEIVQEQPYKIVEYTVGQLKERCTEIQYTVSTIPNAGFMSNNLLSYKEILDLKKSFELAVSRIYNRVKKGVEEIDILQTGLCEEVNRLSSTFNRKRLKIEDIRSDDIFL